MERRSAAVRRSTAVLIAVAGLASAVGTVPYALFAFPPRGAAALVVLAAAAAAAVAAWSLRRFTSLATERPRFGEILLGGWNAVLAPALGAAWALLFYTTFYWGWRLIAWMIGRFGPGAGLEAKRVALWASLAAFALVFIPVVKLATGDLARHLYPDAAGARSPYFSLLTQRRRLWGFVGLSVLLVLIAAGIFLLVDPADWLGALVSCLFLIVTSAQLQALERRVERSAERDKALSALVKLLSAFDYEAIPSPRTGRSDVDPLICRVDLLASSPERTMAIEVKLAAGGRAAVEWHEASQLRTAAWALERFLAEQGDGPQVEPVLVLVGRDRASSLSGYLEDQPIRIVDIADPTLIDRILAEEGREALRQIARDLLEAAGAPAAAARPPAEVPL